MRVVIFCHSILSDWNHGNAHFLRGVTSELQRRGHEVVVYEPAESWSRTQLVATEGPEALERVARAFPHLASRTYCLDDLDVDAALDGADLCLVHEWNEPALIARLGAAHARHPGLTLLFHDTHHRAVSAADELAACDLSGYDGVLAFGRALKATYEANGWGRRVWTWHEAADTAVFHPRPAAGPRADLVWIGNWGDGERAAELEEFLIAPVRELGLSATVYGVRYPPDALAALARAGISYGGWLPNHEVPEVFARHRVTVHVPRRPYVSALPGIPTIRPFEALACGIPLVSALWDDVEGLFRPGRDYLVVRTGREMTAALAHVLTAPDRGTALRASGLQRVHARHTCAHRVDQLLAVRHDVLARRRGAAA